MDEEFSTKPPTQTSPNQNIDQSSILTAVWSSNLKPGFDLEAFDIAFVVSN
jgi:hypothetical protein